LDYGSLEHVVLGLGLRNVGIPILRSGSPVCFAEIVANVSPGVLPTTTWSMIGEGVKVPNPPGPGRDAATRVSDPHSLHARASCRVRQPGQACRCVGSGGGDASPSL
jgi:hypothetical protein